MHPEPTLIEPILNVDAAIRAIIFDVYGTMLISASGDIEEAEISEENFIQALEASGIELADSVEDSGTFIAKILDEFKQAIHSEHRILRSEHNPFPEISILKIWEAILTSKTHKPYLILNGPLCIKCFTFTFEVLSNHIYPMPGVKEVVMGLAGEHYPLGILSNAQFYTPVILNYFLHQSITDSENVSPFHPLLTIFSYQHQRAKPDELLFMLMKNRLITHMGIHADEVLFIGNDMYRDIMPASRVGFKTALFAGDAKSLRLRKDLSEVKDIKPDFILTDMRQVLKILR
jgi:putative hydrolase of the HAD superfamily